MPRFSRVSWLLSRVSTLTTKFQQQGATSFIDKAVTLGRSALQLCPPRQSTERRLCLLSLANSLHSRHEQVKEAGDIDEAIVLGREGLGFCPPGYHQSRRTFLSNLGISLTARYEQLGSERDIDEATLLMREALDLYPPKHPERPAVLASLGGALTVRFRRLGEIRDLEEAVVMHREAVDLCRKKGNPDLLRLLLSNLAAGLANRFEELWAMWDLDEAIVLGRRVVNLSPQGSPLRSAYLVHLAKYLLSRYNQLQAAQDLDEVIALSREALDICSRGHPWRGVVLDNLAEHLAIRHRDLGKIEDIEEAIVLNREVLELPEGYHEHCTALNHLAVHLATRFEKLGEPQDLDEAIALGREALRLWPHGQPNRSSSLENLAGYLHGRFVRLGQSEDKEEMFGLYTQLAQGMQVVSSADLSAARAWIKTAEEFQHPTLLLAHETSLQLLIQHLSTRPLSPQHLLVLKTYTSSLAVDAFSACLRDCSPIKAVELLEQGRGVFWNQLARLRSPLDDVIASGPAGRMLADEFTQLASLIRGSLNSLGPDGQQERPFDRHFELQRVVTEIRKLPGLSHFLLPSPFSDLRRAASGGPVIIVNASQYGCDALIVLHDRDPIHVPLQMTQEHIRDLSTEFRALVTDDLIRLLRKLWDQVVSPIVDVLRTIHPPGSRIWWCPTAEFAALPLHAAGPHTEGQQNLADLYISSYTPTLTALIRARRDPVEVATGRKRFIAIGQAKSPGTRELELVGPELDDVSRRIHGLATFTRLEGEDSRIARVVDELGKNEWVHLSCHSVPNTNQPLASGFSLHDGPLTIQRLIGCDLKNAEFAFLSACATTMGDEDSPDEAIHLASAMQFVGFRSMIGTIREVAETESKTMASTFYQHLVDGPGGLDYTRAALALNETMKSADVPLQQRIRYIHLGA